jgi:drug/metabolite transporter (DMT)-like permease
MERKDKVRSRGQYVLGYGACALAGGLWGTGFYFGKIALVEMGVGHMVLYRFLFACLALLPLILRHPATFNLREWRWLLIASFMGVPVQFLLQFYGLKLTTVSHAALMVGTMPVILAVGAAVFTQERLDRLGWVALLASTTGVSLIVLGGQHASAGGGPSLLGDMLVVLSLVVALGWILLNQRLMHGHTPVVVTAYGVVAGAVMLVLCVVPFSGLPPVRGPPERIWRLLRRACSARDHNPAWNWAFTAFQLRGPVCFSTSNRRWAQSSASNCWATTSAPSPGWVAD